MLQCLCSFGSHSPFFISIYLLTLCLSTLSLYYFLKEKKRKENKTKLLLILPDAFSSNAAIKLPNIIDTLSLPILVDASAVHFNIYIFLTVLASQPAYVLLIFTNLSPVQLKEAVHTRHYL